MDVDTIAAVSTAPGVGGIAIVRISGPGALRVLEGLTTGSSPRPEARRAVLVDLVDPDDGSPLDRALATFFSGPASYTGEDVVELSCHGGWLVPELVLEACERMGARRADPGEFTRRAYLRGKLDLVQAEATGDLIGARSRAAHRAALHQLDRGLSFRLAALREGIVHLEALLAHHIDFPEEDDAPVPVGRILDESRQLLDAVDALLSTAPEGELLREGALTVLAGRPNAGKSSLYNALLGVERAIVTEEPGTTRDALEATVQLGGFPFRLVDTAGLREADSGVERLGIEYARRYLERADLILFCVPAGEGVTEADALFLAGLEGRPVVILETKADLVPSGPTPVAEVQAAGVQASGGSGAGSPGTNDAAVATARSLRVSVVDGEGLDRLRELLPELVYSSVVSAGADAPIVTRERHARALGRARAELAEFREGLQSGLPAEIAATHLRPAETALEELLGTIGVEDILDVVFREFCVGK
jgi:tRNA modification GTPase